MIDVIELQKQIEKLKELKEDFLDQVEEIDTDSRYDQMLEQVETCEACGKGGASLKESDPVAYQCGKVDYLDSEEGETIITLDNGETYLDLEETQEKVNDFLEMTIEDYLAEMED